MQKALIISACRASLFAPLSAEPSDAVRLLATVDGSLDAAGIQKHVEGRTVYYPLAATPERRERRDEGRSSQNMLRRCYRGD
jgi:hypothetical protein